MSVQDDQKKQNNEKIAANSSSREENEGESENTGTATDTNSSSNALLEISYPINNVQHNNNVISKLKKENKKPNLKQLARKSVIGFKRRSGGNGTEEISKKICPKNIEPLSWKKRLEICIGAARGLHYLHTGAKRPIFHCDIKPQNILLDNNMVPKLSHLGFSLQGPLLRSKAKPIKVDMMIGTPGFMAPEYVLTKTFTDKCDVYSFGIVLMVVLSTSYKQSFFEKMYMMADSDLFLEEPLYLMTPYVDIPSFLERISVDEIIDPVLLGKIAPECLGVFIDITKRCLSKDANERPDMGEVQVELEQALALQEDEDACPEP
ncbi:receptor-like protein kinase ANXUR2 [Arachis ipaensis]|uniref:receptor-like protein kinase ANXUR2 n=1 Tax=Arachis ipaensis TaxID=130454 RepID=UPI000A2B7EBF|nr:receptor-like protein kinase ANXUR2 [Arachis ipaensis]XP_025648376.1 receptor-like protein kinase ANXUR2 [Arachis hypogaea]